MNEPIKFCKDCKHLKDIVCQRPVGPSLVTGLEQYRNIFAETERSLVMTGCGVTGKFFYAKG